MKQLPPWLRVASIGVLLTSWALGGCTVKTTVQATATTPVDVTHLYVTVKEVWFSTNATVTANDSNWTKKVLSTPTTVDLASLNSGSLATLANTPLLSGTYTQLRLVLADSSAELESSANDLGLAYNSAVQYVDSSGVSHVVSLEFGSPNSALLIPISIKMNGLSSSSVLTSASSSTSSSSQATATVTVDIDALRNLTLFSYGSQTGALLSPGLKAYDDSNAGTISGQFDVSALSSTVFDNGQGVIVSAEALSSDGTRYVTVKSTRMDSSGNFTLYPLPVDDTAGKSYYDLVVHGPTVETLIITGVPVTGGDKTSVQSSTITLPAAASFTVNTSNAGVPGGTQVDFYQTLPSSSASYLIESAAVNPFSGAFGSDLSLSTGELVYGAYNDGDLISFATAVAQEGAAIYQIVSEGPGRAASALGTTVNGASASSTLSITPPQPVLPTNAIARTVAGSVNLSTPGRYDSLYLLVSRGGQLLDVVNLSASLGSNASVQFSAGNLPGGTADAVYDLAVRAWNSSDAASTLTRVAFADQVDLRGGDASGLSLQLP